MLPPYLREKKVLDNERHSPMLVQLDRALVSLD
jgi:hypothetical protein